MKPLLLFAFLLFTFEFLPAQKKTLDHSVYDGWQSIGERMISNDGKWVVYTVCPQEGDTTLVIQQTDNKYRKEVARGFNAVITEDNRFVLFRIKPFQKELREARIKNRKADDMPKDSLGIVELGLDSVWKVPKVRSYKTPAKAAGWAAYWMEKSKDAANGTDGADLVLKNLATGENKTFNLISEYYFDKKGTKLLMETSRSAKDSLSKSHVILYHPATGKTDTLSRGGNDFRNFVFDEDGSQLAFLAEREAEPKALQKFYTLWYYRSDMDSATALVNKNSVGMKLGMTVSENGNPGFSKSGKRLLFGVAPIQPAKDTTLIESDLVKLDIWHYNDDYLQTQQLVQLNAEQRRNYLAVYDLQNNYLKQLGSPEIPQVIQTNEGDGDVFVGVSDAGKRKEGQWLGTTRKDIYSINVADGSNKPVKQNLHGQVYPSSTGKYILWYDRLAKNYFLWDGTKTKNITSGIKVPLYNVEYDMPDAPGPYGVMGWHEADQAVYVYDQYDIWKIETGAKGIVTNFTSGKGRKSKKAYRYQVTDPEKRFFISNENILLRTFDENSKSSGLADIRMDKSFFSEYDMGKKGYSIGQVTAKKYSTFIYTKENFLESPDLYFCLPAAVYGLTDPTKIISLRAVETRLSEINQQQKDYTWGTAELFKWKTITGKSSEGILYKPENFDPKKKYPVIIYFYEKLSDGLHDYIEPSPPRSSVNVSYFVSNGYVVFYPNIAYGTGHPGKDAFDYIVSGAKSLIAKYKWIDGNRMGIQGHSWGGYQVSYLITKTNMFKAAWAGAPVVNMTSAYGGIRYGTGISRQWQYEKSQSRIGKNLWEALPQFMESSPLFTLNKVNTPVVILHNDNDDAVPYTQGLEMFTALKRLNKKAWLINYNGEPHGVVQRKNRKDLAMRFSQFFDWLLMDEKPAKWLTDGVPALKKGKDWGLDME
jgi:dipeptidyl aminopeptidase/acylaminoacyl peptidase